MSTVQTLPREYSLPAKPAQSRRGNLVVDDNTAAEVMEVGAVGLVTKSFLLKVIAGTVRERLANT